MNIQTLRLPWVSWREAVTADDTAITAFSYSDWPTVGTIDLRDAKTTDAGVNSLKDAVKVYIAAWGAGGDDKTITGYKIYGRCRQNGPIMLLLAGVMTSGSKACAVHPITGATLTSNYWVDTITATSGLLVNNATIMDSASNQICILTFDTLIWKELYFEYDENASGMTEFNVMITGC